MRFIPAVSLVQIRLPLPRASSRGRNCGPMVKRLRHRPFTAVTRVRFPFGSPYGRIAQLVRALASHARGQRFESVYAHQRIPCNQAVFRLWLHGILLHILRRVQRMQGVYRLRCALGHVGAGILCGKDALYAANRPKRIHFLYYTGYSSERKYTSTYVVRGHQGSGTVGFSAYPEGMRFSLPSREAYPQLPLHSPALRMGKRAISPLQSRTDGFPEFFVFYLLIISAD